jgi:hypothetical protein
LKKKESRRRKREKERGKEEMDFIAEGETE